jgi:putative ABC transport system permease protein
VLYIALKMLMGVRAKYAGLLLGIAFTAFLVTFSASYFAGFMTRGFALIAENGGTDVWVMDPAVTSVEQTVNMSSSALARVRSVSGVRYATPLALGAADARLPNGRFQPFQVIGVDDATLVGAPALRDGASQSLLRAPDAILVDAGGTTGKLTTPARKEDQWPTDGAHLAVPMRELQAGDEFLVNDNRVRVAGLSATLPRFPPRPLIYTTYSNAMRILPPERTRLTFVLVRAADGIIPSELARRIQLRTGLRARTTPDFKADTVRWYLVNSEDVGDMSAMLILAMSVGFGVVGIMLYMFTYESLKQYAVLKAMGATPQTLLMMVLVQSALCAALGTGIGVGFCALLGELVSMSGYPFRMMWFTPLAGALGVLIVSMTAATISARPVRKLQPSVVFSGR